MRGVGTLMSNGVHRYHDAMATPRCRLGPSTSRGSVVVALTLALLITATSCGSDPSNGTEMPSATTATTPPTVVTRLVDGRPARIPAEALPAGAEATGREADAGTTASAAVEFTLPAGDHVAIADTTRDALISVGWELFGRIYDDSMMQMTFTSTEGATLTWTIMSENGLSGSAVVAYP